MNISDFFEDEATARAILNEAINGCEMPAGDLLVIAKMAKAALDDATTVESASEVDRSGGDAPKDQFDDAAPARDPERYDAAMKRLDAEVTRLFAQQDGS